MLNVPSCSRQFLKYIFVLGSPSLSPEVQELFMIVLIFHLAIFCRAPCNLPADNQDLMVWQLLRHFLPRLKTFVFHLVLGTHLIPIWAFKSFQGSHSVPACLYLANQRKSGIRCHLSLSACHISLKLTYAVLADMFVPPALLRLCPRMTF